MGKQTSSEQQNALGQLLQAEQEAKERVSQAKKRAEEIVNNAQTNAADEIKKAREEADAEAKTIKKDAKDKGRSEDDLSKALGIRDPQSLKQEAEKRIDRAARELFRWTAFAEELE